jgi:hypothetical protein
MVIQQMKNCIFETIAGKKQGQDCVKESQGKIEETKEK